MSRVLALSSNYDLPTMYVSRWIQRIIDQARILGHSVYHLADGELTETNLYGAIEQQSPEYVFAGGHGSSSVFTTMDAQPLIVACSNDEVLAGAQVLFASCLCGVELVPSAYGKGALAVAGFSSEFTWVVSEPYDPASDPYAYPFERMIVEPVLEVLRGRGWAGWYSRLRAVAAEERAKWGQVTDDPLAAQIVYCIDHDAGCATYVAEGEYVGGGGGLDPVLLLGLLYGLSKVV